MKSFCSFLVAVSLLVGCENRTVNYKVQITSLSCTDPQPLQDAQQLRFRVTGDGISAPLDVVAPVNSKAAQIPAIPAGTNRVLEVRAYAGEVASGRVVAVGRSAPFDVPNVLPPEGERELTISVFLRRANAFTRPSAISSPDDCQKMGSPRAGHTATLLPDGKVLIAGGFTVAQTTAADGGTTLTRTTLNTTEIFDPQTGGFSDAPPMGVNNSDGRFAPLPRAFHSATLLSTGQVMLAGGEVWTGGSSFITRSALVFDYPPKQGSPAYGGFQLEVGRMRHGAAHDADAGVVLVGGIGSDGGVVETVEWYESQTGKVRRATPTLKRVGMGVLPVQGGRYVAVTGGSDGENVKDEVSFLRFDPSQGTFVLDATRGRLNRLRRNAAVAPIGDSNRLLLLGGYSTPQDNFGIQPVDTSEILRTTDATPLQAPTVLEGPNVASPRGDVCAATLRDGRVLVIGGRTGQLGLPARSDDTVELISPSDDGRATALGLEKLSPPRYWHTCTTLKDGSVLVTGGLNESFTGDQEALDDAWIFTPAPAGP